MLGAIVGDIIGSEFEFKPLEGEWDSFPLFSASSRFTDDTVMTLAVADALRRGYGKDGLHDLFIDSMHTFGRKWLTAGYGQRFYRWLIKHRRDPYNSFGNGSAMRVSPVGWVARSLAEAEALAAMSAGVTHNHPEGIKGAQAVAGAIFLARSGMSKDEISKYITETYQYDVSRTLDAIRKTYRFDETCQGSVPEAIIAFLESGSFEEAVRKAVWLRGDADTQAAIAGSIAEAFYGCVPAPIATMALERLDDDLYKKYLEWNMWLNT